MKYSDIDSRKTAFIFELDNVLYPEKDYLYQVYYLYAAMLEYINVADAKQLTDMMVSTYLTDGKDAVFTFLRQKFNLDEKYRQNLHDMMLTSKLPLKLLLYQKVLALLQDIVVDRKKIFIVTNGNPQQQLNKIKQMEWHGLENYLVAYFADEIVAKPETNVIDDLMKEHNLQRRELVMIGHTNIDQLCAENCGIDYYDVDAFLLEE